MQIEKFTISTHSAPEFFEFGIIALLGLMWLKMIGDVIYIS